MGELNEKTRSIRKNHVIEKYLTGAKTIELWESEEIEEYTLAAINELCEFVYENNDHYRKKLEQINYDKKKKISLDEFQKLEFLNKEDLRLDPYLVLSVPKDKVSQVHTSTGTTGGDIIYMMYTLNDIWVRDFAPHIDELFKINKGDVVINALPYEMSSSGQSFHRVIQIQKDATVIPVGKGGFYSTPDKTLKIIKELGGNVLISTPSYVMNLFKISKKLGYDPKVDFKLREIWLTGEGCSNNFRKRIEKNWGCIAKFYYGSLEGGSLGVECDNKEGYHITAGHVFIEIIDTETGQVLEPGQIGEVVITTLLREGAPLIRYRTADVGYLEEEECGCGCKLPKLFLRGRRVDQIEIDGNSNSPIYIEENLMKIEEVGNDYRIYVYDEYIEIEVEVVGSYESKEALEETISSQLEYLCGVPNKIKIVDEITYSGGKTRRVEYMNR
jgi:phenylacetate-CoA ligase